MSNYSTLQENTMLGLSETAGALYLKLIDVFQDDRKAFMAADNFDKKAGATLDYILRNSPAHDVSEKTITELSQYFAERWRNNFMGKD